MYAIFRGFCIGCLLAAAGCSSTKKAPQTSFASPDQAVDALVAALRSDSTESLSKVLGPDAQKLIYTGDAVQDNNARDRFLAKYDARHSIATNPDGSAVLVVGDNEWPMPIPLVRDGSGGTWRFDSARGADEMINRRIGDNELSTIKVCRATVDAQMEYQRRNPEGTAAFAQKFFSDEGHKNGLYWKTGDGEPLSPLGELVADAAAEGYVKTASQDAYHGYFFTILREQGPMAPGGKKSYLVDGKMTGGFAIMAWPAGYGSSGITSFIVSRDGIVYQRDLGKDTDAIARATTAFNPDSGWVVCED